MKFPHASTIDEGESLLFFFNHHGAPARCGFCTRTSLEPPVVRSTGMRIDAYYSRDRSLLHMDGTLATPICWLCLQERSHGHEAGHRKWRTVVAGFLNALHASDPDTYYCALRDLG